MKYPQQLPFPDQEPTIHLGEKPFYIGFVGVGKKTKEESLVSNSTICANSLERLDAFAKPFSYIRKSTSPANN